MRFIKVAVKIIISVGLLAYLINYVGPQEIVNEFAKIGANSGFNFFFYALIFAIISVLLMSLRWQILLRGYKFNPRYPRLFGYYLIGMFFNNFLPSTIGGDVIRIYKVVDDIQDRTSGFASVIIERIMGIAATLFMAFFSLILVWREFHNPYLLYASGTLFLVIVVFFFALIRNRPFKLLLRFFDKFTIFKIGEKFSKLFEAIHYFKDRRRILGFAFLFSLFSQTSIVFMNYSLAKAFSIDISISFLFMVVPVTFVLTMLPSINGIGIRELGFVGLLGEAGVASASALSISFMNLIIPMIISITGAILFIIQKRKTGLEEKDVIKETI